MDGMNDNRGGAEGVVYTVLVTVGLIALIVLFVYLST